MTKTFCFVIVVLCFQALTAFNLTKPRMLTSISNGSPIYGVAPANSLLHVIRENSSVIQLYNISNSLFTALGPLAVLMDKTGYYDMVYLPHRNSLALLNWFDAFKIFILSLKEPYELKSFTFTDGYTSAALAVDQNDAGDDDLIIVTEGASKMVKVFNPDGNSVIQFQLLITKDPRHTVKISSNVYATTFGYELTESHYVCRFNTNGYVLGRCFGGRPGSAITQLNVPARLALTSDKNYLLLADMRNQRILKIKADLSVGEVLLGKEEGVNYPYRMFLDEKNGYLYVAENELDGSGLAVRGKVNVYSFG